jgi:DNA primase
VQESGIELKRGGKDWLGRCPFHEDDTASLVVTPAKNLWHCFGCGIGGGPIDWVMKRRGVKVARACVRSQNAPLEQKPSTAGSASSSSARKPLRRLAKMPCPTTDGRRGQSFTHMSRAIQLVM